MEPVYIYFKEAFLDNQNRFNLDFSNEIVFYQILFLQKMITTLPQ